MTWIRRSFGPPPKDQEYDDEIFEVMETKAPDHTHYVRYLCWFLVGITGLLIVLGIAGIFAANKSYLMAAGLLSVVEMVSAMTCELGLRWKQRHLLLVSAILNTAWLALIVDLVLIYSLAATGKEQARFHGEIAFHVLVTVAGIASLLLAIIHLEFFYVLILEKDPSFLSLCLCSKRAKKQPTDEVELAAPPAPSLPDIVS